MAGVNRVTLLGHLGADPELKTFDDGGAVCNFSLATNESWTDKQGQKQERVEWHRVVVWGKRAEVCAKYLGKGRQAYVEGKLRTRSWEDREGNKRFMTEVVANDVQFLSGGGKQEQAPAPAQDDGFGGPDDDIPFAANSIDHGLDDSDPHCPGRRAV